MRETVWLHMTAGRGPVECQIAVARLAQVYRSRAAFRGPAMPDAEAIMAPVPDQPQRLGQCRGVGLLACECYDSTHGLDSSGMRAAMGSTRHRG